MDREEGLKIFFFIPITIDEMKTIKFLCPFCIKYYFFYLTLFKNEPEPIMSKNQKKNIYNPCPKRKLERKEKIISHRDISSAL